MASTGNQQRVFVAFQQRSAIDRIRQQVESCDGFVVVAATTNPHEIESLAQATAPNVVILENAIARSNGYELIHRLMSHRRAKCLILGSPELGARRLGPSSIQVLLDAAGSDVDVSVLTKRELSVLRHIAEGHTRKEIAAALGVSVRTVENHRSNIVHKLGIRTTAELTRYAVRRGIAPL